MTGSVPPADDDRELDVVVSLVLFRPDPVEVAACIGQVLDSKRRTHVVIIDNSPVCVPLPNFPTGRVTYVQTGTNLGYGRAHNRAIALSRGQAPFHLIMNTDVVLKGDVIDEMLTFMEAHPDAGMSSPLLRYPDGRLQTQCRLLPTPANIFGRGFLDRSAWTQRMNRRYELQHWGYDSVQNIPFLPGCFMLIRSEILQRVAGFDERFFLFAEDLDLSRRIHSIAPCLFVPTSTVEHELRTRAKFNYRRHLYKVVNLTRYFNKWGWFRDKDRALVNRRTLHDIGARPYPAPSIGYLRASVTTPSP